MSSLETLAATISEQVSKLTALHQELNTPLPTLDKAGSRDYATEADTPEGEALRKTRSQILDAAADLIRLVRGPTEHVLTLTWSVSYSLLLDAYVRSKPLCIRRGVRVTCARA
jgi:6-hydroxytryprostatin B O-methyltransferase